MCVCTPEKRTPVCDSCPKDVKTAWGRVDAPELPLLMQSAAARTAHLEMLAAAYLCATDIDPRDALLIECLNQPQPDGSLKSVWYFAKPEEVDARRRLEALEQDLARLQDEIERHRAVLLAERKAASGGAVMVICPECRDPVALGAYPDHFRDHR